MATFNLISYENGRIVKTTQAETMQQAQNDLELKGYDCQDDNFLEPVEETDKHNKMESKTIYIDEIR